MGCRGQMQVAGKGDLEKSRASIQNRMGKMVTSEHLRMEMLVRVKF